MSDNTFGSSQTISSGEASATFPNCQDAFNVIERYRQGELLKSSTILAIRRDRAPFLQIITEVLPVYVQMLDEIDILVRDPWRATHADQASRGPCSSDPRSSGTESQQSVPDAPSEIGRALVRRRVGLSNDEEEETSKGLRPAVEKSPFSWRSSANAGLQ